MPPTKPPVRGAGAGRAGDPRKLAIEPASDGLPALAQQCLSASVLRASFQKTVRWQPEIINDRTQLDSRAPRAAAVLVPLLTRADGSTDVLLTTRPATLRSHSGQIAFPGGSADDSDQDRVATALREAHEEVGLPTQYVEVLGQLPEYFTGSGFAVTPVIGLIDADTFNASTALNIDPIEVEEVFQVPLNFLMDPANHQRRTYTLDSGDSRTFYSMPWISSAPPVEYFIWGVTAAILRNFYHYLRATQD